LLIAIDVDEEEEEDEEFPQLVAPEEGCAQVPPHEERTPGFYDSRGAGNW
jgi:hypothetical protein